MTQTALITGVSTGIGRAIAEALAGAGWQVYGSVRKEADAAAFEAALNGRGKALIFDVTDRAAVEAAAAQLQGELGADGLDLLINNAGLSVSGPLEYVKLEDMRYQFEVNTISVFSVTQVFLPLLGGGGAKRAKPGRIINISSISGQVALPFQGPYSASKFALESLSDVMRREFMVHGIDVIAIEPGPIKTPIWDKIDASRAEAFAGSPYEVPLRKTMEVVSEFPQTGLPAEELGELVVRITRTARPKSRYIIKRGGPWDHLLMRWLPDRWLDAMIAKKLELK